MPGSSNNQVEPVEDLLGLRTPIAPPQNFPDRVTATDARHMLVSGECCRWGWVQGCFAFLEVHAFNETVRDGINVPHLTIRKDIATKAFHELMNFDGGPSAFLVDDVKGFHVRIKLLPLTGPVGSNLFFPDATPFDALGQLTFSLMSARALSISR